MGRAARVDAALEIFAEAEAEMTHPVLGEVQVEPVAALVTADKIYFFSNHLIEGNQTLDMLRRVAIKAVSWDQPLQWVVDALKRQGLAVYLYTKNQRQTSPELDVAERDLAA